ncbi:NAD(P)/FAD-dependent oxidoreductase [Chloroflexota bacterium]
MGYKLDDVLVIGGGPVGSRVAAGLANSGYRVKVLEQDSQEGERKCCTGLVGLECVKRFAITAESVIRPLNSAVFHSPGGKEIKLEREGAQAYVLNRYSLDRALVREAGKKGTEYIFSCKVTNAIGIDGHVQVDTIYGGEERSFNARSIVLASGFSPMLAEKLGLGKVRDYTVGAQAEVEITSVRDVEIHFSRNFAPGFFAWVVPTASPRALVGLMARKNAKQHLKKFLMQLYGEGKINDFNVDIQCGVVPLRPLERSYGKSILAVGDAAGQVKPTTGGGIYYGLLCADIATKVLVNSFEHGDLTAKRLSRYQSEWKKALGSELRMGYLARQVYERLSDSKVDELFDVIKDYSLDKTTLNLPGFSFDWHGDILRNALSHSAVRSVLGVVLRGLFSGDNKKTS